MNNHAIPPNGRAARQQAVGEAVNQPGQPIAGAAQHLAQGLLNARAHQVHIPDRVTNSIILNDPFIRLLCAQTINELLACRSDVEQGLLSHHNISAAVFSCCIKNFVRVVVAHRHSIPQLAGAQRQQLTNFSIFLAELTHNHPRSRKVLREMTPTVAFVLLTCLPQPAAGLQLSPSLTQIRHALGLYFIEEDQSRCEYLPQDLLSDRSFVQQIIIAHGECVFGFLDGALREAPYFQKLLRYATGASSLEHSEHLEDRRDTAIATAAATYNPAELKFLDDSLKSNRDFILNTLTYEPSVLHYETAGFCRDPNFMLTAVDSNGEALFYAHPALKNNVEIVVAAVENNGDSLSHASVAAKDNYEIVLLATNNCPRALRYASDRLRDSEQLVLAVIEKNADVLQYASHRVKDNNVFMVTTSALNPGAFRYASDRLKSSAATVKAIVRQYGMNLEMAATELKNNRDIVMSAIKQNPMAIQFASERLRNDLDVAAEAVKQDGMTLQFTHKKPRLDRALVMSAVSSSGLEALEFAPEFKSDYLIVELAKLLVPN